MLPDVRAAIASAARRLAATSETPRLDAELLMAHALGVERDVLLLGRLEDPVPVAFDMLVERRATHEPIAYITGRRAFWTIALEVTPAVLIPRPDSETLIEAAVAHFGDKWPRTVLDLGTGSGALLLAALDQWAQASGVGVDASAAALEVARSNAERLGMTRRATFRQGGWDGVGQAFDLILCNPPYVADGEALSREVAGHEPSGALFAGADGLDDYRRIAPLLRDQLAPGGLAAIEIGATQAAAVCALIAAEGFEPEVRKDLAGRDRCVVVHG